MYIIFLFISILLKAWKKYYRNPMNYFIIPKYNNYCDMELLVEMFKGRLVDTSKKNINIVDHIKKDDYVNL